MYWHNHYLYRLNEQRQALVRQHIYAVSLEHLILLTVHSIKVNEGQWSNPKKYSPEVSPYTSNPATFKRTILRFLFDLYVSLDAKQCRVNATTKTFAIRCEKMCEN